MFFNIHQWISFFLITAINPFNLGYNYLKIKITNQYSKKFNILRIKFRVPLMIRYVILIFDKIIIINVNSINNHSKLNFFFDEINIFSFIIQNSFEQ